MASCAFAALTFTLVTASASRVSAQPPIATIGLTPGWATFGQAVPQGLAPAGSGLRAGLLPTQTDIKNTWPDGSIKFAVVTVQVPSAGNYPLTAAAISPGTFAPAIPTASATFNIGGVIYAATLPSGPSADKWLSGPLAYEGRSVVTPTASGNPHPFLRVVFDTRVFNDGSARVDFTVENVLDLAGATAVTYDVTLALNGASVFSKPAVQHFYLTRWRKTFTLPSTSVATITPDMTPFNVSRALPPYLPVVTNRLDQIDLASDPSYDIMGTGALNSDMSALSGRGSLAPYPDWTARYLVHKDPAQRAFVLANGDLAGSWPVHVREAESSATSGIGAGRFISLNQRPSVWYDQRGQGAGVDFIKGAPLPILEYTPVCPAPPAPPPSGCQPLPAGQTRLIPDNAHQPSLAYVPYLLTGDRYYADEMMFWADYAMLRTSNGDGVRGSLGILAHNEVRGFGWALRNLADAAAYSPEAAVRSYLSEKVLANLQWLDNYANSQDPVANPLKVLWPGYRSEAGFIALWEQAYLAWAIDRANRHGFVGGLAHRDAIAALQLKLFTSEPDWPRETIVQSPGVTLFDSTFAPAGTVLTWGMPYLLNYGTSPSPSVFTYNKTIADVWAQTNNPNLQRQFAGSYGPEARLDLMIGIEAGWNGAQNAYDYLWPFIGVNIFWDSAATGRAPDLAERAGWAVDFYPAAATTAVALALAQDPTPVPAQLLTPALGEAFGSSAQSFTWTAGTSVTGYKLDLGTTQGASNLHAGAETQAQSELVTGLPADGRTVWVRLSSKIDSAFQSSDYSFTSYTAPTPSASAKTVPTIVWATPRDIAKGTPLTTTQLSATASVPGTFVYSPAAGTVLNAGNGQTLSVMFNPTDTATYQSSAATVALNVLNPPTMTWNAPAPINFGTALGVSQLNATVNPPGSGAFAYSPPLGTILNAGQRTLSVTFTPTNTAFAPITTTVPLIVLKRTPVITWPTPADITVGTPLGATQLNAAADVGGSFVYAPPAGTGLSVGPGQRLTVTFTPTDTANVASASAAVAISVVSSGSGTTPTPVKIGTTIAGSWKDATGHSGQSHLVFSPKTNRWWLFTLSSAHDSAGDRTVRTYVSSGPDLATATWSATASSPTLGNTGGATSSLLAGGRSLGVALRTIGTTDYVHVFVSAAFDGQVSSNGHARAQLGAGSIAWSVWNNPGSPNAASEWQGPPGTGPTGLPSHTPWGNSVGMSTGGFIHHFSTTMDQEVDCAVGRSTNADTAASWVNGFGANTSPTGRAGTSPPWTTAVIDKTMAKECKVLAFAPLASDVMLAVYGNGATLQPQITNLRYQRSGNAGTWTNIPVSGGGDGNVFGTTATIDQNDWALVSLSTTVIYTFRAKSVGTGVDGVVYNTGTNNWSAVLSAPPLFGTGQSFKSGGGLFGATDGANVWLFAINNSDAANSILFTKFDGLSWTPWAAVPGTSAGTHTRNFITGYRTVSSNQIGLAWTEGSTNVDVFTTSLSMGAAGPSPVTATLSAPTNGSTLSGATTLSASASSTAGTIAGVQFKLDGANLGAEDTTSPYSVSWDIATASVGTHFLSAVARDITGATGFTNTVSVTVTNDTTPPAVSMIAPATGATVSGTSVVVAADASDDVGVVGVQFLLDGAALGTEVTTAPYAINWNSTTATSGTHTLSARAGDAAGRITVSASISVSIPANKVTPTITWAAPAAIPYGTPLGAAQFNATASVPGTFVYSPAVGTVLPVGGGQPLSVSFTPTDTTTYTTAAANVSIMVTKGTPGITWPAPTSIFYGTPLGALQLNASASVPGTFAYTPATETLLSAGAAQTLSVTFMPADVTNYGPVTRTVAIDVFKATPTITWAAPSPIPFGTLLSSAQLNATADVRGTFTYSPPAGAVLSPGVQTLTVTFTPADTENYTIPASKSVSLTVAKGTPDISWPQPAAMVYGTALGGTELNATSIVPGTFAYAPAAGTVLPAGVNTLSVTFTPTDPASYNSATSSVTITVNKATPTITWPTPAAITYGTALSATQLNASSTTPGTFAYTPTLGTVFNAGAGQTLSVMFTPTDPANYTSTTKTVSISVLKATPVITWVTPADITFGTGLSATQLNATVNTPGTFTYTPVLGTVLNAGAAQALSVAFTPTDGANFTAATKTATINVLKAAPTITWPTPAAITYGTALSGSQLNATVGGGLVGSFGYTPAAGQVPNAGTQTLSVTFTPTDTNYGPATKTVSIIVNPATPTITWAPPAITYGTALSATQLNATVAPQIAGSFAYTLDGNPAQGQRLNAGSYTLTAVFTPSAPDSANYVSATTTANLTVTRATPTITWPDPTMIYGPVVSATQLNATVAPQISGSFSYTLDGTPAQGQRLNAGSYTLTAVFTPGAPDSTNYVSATKTVTLTVTKATPVIDWLAPAEITYGTKLGSVQLNATANVNGTLAYTPAAGEVLDGGSQTLSVTFTPHDSANYSSATKTVSMFVRKSQPHMNIDRPSNNSVSGSSVTIEGWAADLSGTSGAGINTVHVWAYPRSTAPAMFLGAATLGLDRPDVAAVFGLPRLRFSGFSLTVPSLAAGGYQLVVFARSDVTGTFNQSVTMNLTVAAPDPVTRIDVPTNGSVLSPSFTIAGWSIDRASPTGSGINALHAYAYPAAGGSPIFLGAASYGATRADVGASFGQRFTPSGFSLNATLSPGTYTLVLYPRSTVSNDFVSPVVSQVTVATPVSRPALSIDTPAAGAVVGETFDIAGWAIDLSSWTGTGIDTLHAYAYPESGGAPQLLGAAAYGSARPDVGNIFGSRFTPSGFRLTAKLKPGRYMLVVYPHSAINGMFGNPTVVHITVSTLSARAVIPPDRPTGGEDPNRLIAVSERTVAVSVVRPATWARSDGRPSRSAENRNSSPAS